MCIYAYNAVMQRFNVYKMLGYAVAALLLGASMTLLAFVLVLNPVASTQSAAAVAATEQIEEPVQKEPTPEVYPYIEIVNSCDHAHTGACAYVYSTPSFSTKTAEVLRTGVVLRVGDIIQNEQGVWYEILFDEWVRYPDRVSPHWYVAQSNARVFFDIGIQELTDDTPKTNKHIIVDRSDQTLYAYDGDALFMHTDISTGLMLTPTPRGTFSIYKKTPTRYMQGPLPGISNQYYDLPGVPWTLYFTHQGGALHGAYWHNSFGQRWSHGCVNLSLTDAQKLYYWADLGTAVYVRD